MDDATLQVKAGTAPGEGLVLAVGGYLDQDGGETLAREAHAVQDTQKRRIRIDLRDVCLFNCSGARQLITLLHDLESLGYTVELVGVRPPLQQVIDMIA